MMKITVFWLLSLVPSATAAPAIVWKKDITDSYHSSKLVKSSSLISDLILSPHDETQIAAAVFVLGRASNGLENLSVLASSGSLPQLASKYSSASVIHSHVDGVESVSSISRDARKEGGKRVLEVSLDEFSQKAASLGQSVMQDTGDSILFSKAGKEATLREKALATADVFIVNIPASTNPDEIDFAVVKALENKSIRSVVLVGVRSHNEVKYERSMQSRRKMTVTAKHSGRRLVDAAGANAADETTGVYYVHMTPNIFAGILYTFFFAFLTYTGINCMGMIAGQDVYVHKMPTIGREA
jgi:BarA-like signal transduction histidine kinase